MIHEREIETNYEKQMIQQFKNEAVKSSVLKWNIIVMIKFTSVGDRGVGRMIAW